MNTRKTLDLLRSYESPNVTHIEPDGAWPIVWERAKGVNVWDAEGEKYLDLTAAFGVAASGHANPRVVKAGQKQMNKLLHAMGDVHPHALKAQLARELSRLTFERWSTSLGKTPPLLSGKTIFCNSGFEAVEAALKTAMLATGKPGVVAFRGGYHGLGYGALNATERTLFRAPFRSQLRGFGHFVLFPCSQSDATTATIPLSECEARINGLFRRKSIGAILVEPIQVRGGINIPSPEFLPMLRRLCDEQNALLILDEIYTGFGRTGEWFACEYSGTLPDLVCVGKALTGGFPLSACIGRSALMDAAWPRSTGEAIHTSTFLGHPVGCAMALAQIEEIKAKRLVRRSADLGEFLLSSIRAFASKTIASSSAENRAPGLKVKARGLGLLAGIEFTFADGKPATRIVLEITKRMLHDGFILLPEGEHSNVLGFTPPLTITRTQLEGALSGLADVMAAMKNE